MTEKMYRAYLQSLDFPSNRVWQRASVDGLVAQVQERPDVATRWRDAARLFWVGTPRWEGPRGSSSTGMEAIREFEDYTGAESNVKLSDL